MDEITDAVNFIYNCENKEPDISDFYYVFDKLKNNLKQREYFFKSSEKEKNTIHEFLLKYMFIFYKNEGFQFNIDINFLMIFFSVKDKLQNMNLKYLDQYLYLYYLMGKKLELNALKHSFCTIINSKINKNNGEFTKKNFVDLIEFDDKFISMLEMKDPSMFNFISNLLYKSDYIEVIIKALHKKNLFSDNIFNQMIEYATNKQNIYNYLNECEYIFTQQNLKSSCYYRLPNALNMILNQKIPFNEKIIEELFTCCYNKNILDCIQIFTNFNYVPTQNILLKMLDKNVNPDKKMIQEKFMKNVEFIKDVEILLNKYSIYPNNFDIKPSNNTVVILLSRQSKLACIKQYIKKHKITLNIECLREACKHKNYKSVIKYLIETHNLKPDSECIKNSIKMAYNSQLSYVYEKSQ